MAEKGFDCILKLGGDVIGAARSVDPSFEADEQDTSRRDTSPWDDWQQGRKRMTADIETLWVPTAAGVVAIEDAWFNDSSLTFEITDEDGNGWSGDLGVLDFNPAQDMDNAVTMSVSTKSKGQVSQIGTS